MCSGCFNSLSTNHTKWSNTLKQFAGNRNCLSVFDHFVGLALKELMDLFHNIRNIYFKT